MVEVVVGAVVVVCAENVEVNVMAEDGVLAVWVGGVVATDVGVMEGV